MPHTRQYATRPLHFLGVARAQEFRCNTYLIATQTVSSITFFKFVKLDAVWFNAVDKQNFLFLSTLFTINPRYLLFECITFVANTKKYQWHSHCQCCHICMVGRAEQTKVSNFESQGRHKISNQKHKKCMILCVLLLIRVLGADTTENTANEKLKNGTTFLTLITTVHFQIQSQIKSLTTCQTHRVLFDQFPQPNEVLKHQRQRLARWSKSRVRIIHWNNIDDVIVQQLITLRMVVVHARQMRAKTHEKVHIHRHVRHQQCQWRYPVPL